MKLALVLTIAAVCTAAAAAATSPKVEHTAAGTNAAQASLLRIGDFGSGWTSSSTTTGAGLNFACPGFTPKQNDIVEIGTATSPTFKASTIGPIVAQRTSVYANAASAAKLWRRAAKPKLIDCVAQSLEALRSRGVSVAITSQDRISFPAIGDGIVGYRVVATLSGKQRLKTFYDVIVVRGGSAISQLTISQFQKAVPLNSEIALAKTAARRMGAGGPVA